MNQYSGAGDGVGGGAQLASVTQPRVAVVRMDNLGDHVLGAGVLASLRARFAHSPITLIVPETVKDLYARCPLIDNVLVLPPPAAYLQSVFSLNAVIAKASACALFDIVVNPRFAEDYYFAAALCKAVAAPNARVVGFSQARSVFKGYDPNACFNVLLDAPETLHVSRYAALVARYFESDMADRRAVHRPAAEPAVWDSDEDWENVASRYGLAARAYAVVGLGASFPYKEPSDEVCSSMLRALTTLEDIRIVVIGSTAERARAAALVAAAADPARITLTCGELRLHEVCALMRRALLYLGPDSGPKHIAAATGTPVIEVAWVTPGHPANSRGPATAGRCWSAWGTRSATVYPPALSTPGMGGAAPQPIRGISEAQITRAIAQVLQREPAL